MKEWSYMAVYKPLQEIAYEYLRDKIAAGGLEAGIIYSETKMAKEIGVSRTPFKDALVRLSQDRYIDIIPSRGFCLHVLSEKDIINTYQSRIAIEGFCSLYLHLHRSERNARSVIRELESDMEDMKSAIEEGRPYAEILGHDLAFHSRIVRYSDNNEMIRLYESYNHQLFDIAMKTFERSGRPVNALEEHREIYRNIVSDEISSDTEVYRSVMRHVESTRSIVLEVLENAGRSNT